jgi:hypothetical protein
LLSLLARDGFIPHAFAVRGARLAFSNGILLVAAISAILILAFRGSVSALIPLFTVGAFGAFTLSQAGMARHWWRKRGTGWQVRLAVNAIGAVVTSVVLVIVIVSKFTSGAWIVVVVLPMLVYLIHSLGVHHDRVERALRVRSAPAAEHVLARPRHQHAVITVERIDRSVLQAVAYARGLNAEIEGVYVTDNKADGDRLRDQWQRMHIGVPLVVLESPVRSYSRALLRYLDLIEGGSDNRHVVVTVVLPEVLPTRWWHPLVHNYFAWSMKWTLLFRPNTTVTSVPYEVRD